MFTRADHVALSVKDMERVIAFYRDVIGMEKVFDREFAEPMAQLIGVPGARARVVHMKLGDSVIELFDYGYPRGRDPRPGAQQSDFGLTHIGFIVPRRAGRDPTRGVCRILWRRGIRGL
jgi:catechol 2,3-dioxygenase-like lactoylglutathione lyase family enzyme